MDFLAVLPTTAEGTIDCTLMWPAGAPVGLETYWQFWVVDPGGPADFAASRAIQGTTP